MAATTTIHTKFSTTYGGGMDRSIEKLMSNVTLCVASTELYYVVLVRVRVSDTAVCTQLYTAVPG